jgi:dihydrofolate reductase
MGLTLIVAMARNRVIGREGDLPWRLPADLRHFKANTVGKPIVMGRLTYESIGRPLPRRRNLVLTRNQGFTAEGVEVFHSLDTALESCPEDEVMLIGGAKIYALGIHRCDRMLLTVVDAEVDGDVRFPEFDVGDWTIESREDHGPDEKNDFGYSFIDLRRGGQGAPAPSPFPSALPPRSDGV